MKSFNEKEKKLNEVLNKLSNLSLENPQNTSSIEELNNQKNQLEIEKNEIENKYLLLKEDYENLKLRLEELKEKQIFENKKETKFAEKIDELNQETDILLEEVDKWQM